MRITLCYEKPLCYEKQREGGKLKQMDTEQTVVQSKKFKLSKLLLLPCVAIAVMLIAASCGGSGAPTGFSEEDGGDTVRDNFIKGCEVAVKDDNRLASRAVAICQCTYDMIVRDSLTSDGVTFEEFDRVDDDLRENINRLRDPTPDRVITKIREYMRDCIADRSG